MISSVHRPQLGKEQTGSNKCFFMVTVRHKKGRGPWQAAKHMEPYVVALRPARTAPVFAKQSSCAVCLPKAFRDQQTAIESTTARKCELHLVQYVEQRWYQPNCSPRAFVSMTGIPSQYGLAMYDG